MCTELAFNYGKLWREDIIYKRRDYICIHMYEETGTLTFGLYSHFYLENFRM